MGSAFFLPFSDCHFIIRCLFWWTCSLPFKENTFCPLIGRYLNWIQLKLLLGRFIEKRKWKKTLDIYNLIWFLSFSFDQVMSFSLLGSLTRSLSSVRKSHQHRKMKTGSGGEGTTVRFFKHITTVFNFLKLVLIMLALLCELRGLLDVSDHWSSLIITDQYWSNTDQWSKPVLLDFRFLKQH